MEESYSSTMTHGKWGPFGDEGFSEEIEIAKTVRAYIHESIA
jgi:hypothetical protein